MKKTIKTLFAIAAAAIASVSCVKDNSIAESNFPSERTVNFLASSLDTKTSFTTPDGESYPTVWNEDDQVKVVLNFAAESTTAVTPSADGKTASFSINIAKDTTVYKFYAMSPASAYLSKSADMKGWGFTVPNTQTPTAESVDPAAQILVAASESTTTLPETVALSFSHWTAYAKMSISNLDLKGATVNSVSVTTEKNIAGRWYYYCETTDAHQSGETVENSASNTITINTTSLDNIWFALAPVDMSGKKVSVTVNTSAGTFTKEITLGANKKFESGKIAKFTVNMSGISVTASKVYTRVKNVSELLANSEIIIAAAADTAAFAIGNTQNTNNRAAVAVTKSADQIVDPSNAVEIFKVEAGVSQNSYAFNATKTPGYLYAPGGGNYIRTSDLKNAAASWTVSFDETGAASIVGCGNAEQKYMRYNFNGGNRVFSCYKSTSSVQDLVAIYKLEGSGDDQIKWKALPELTTEIKSAAIKEGESIEIGASTTSDAEITYSTSDASIATVEDDFIVGVKAGSCNITVSVAETENFGAVSVVIPVTVTAAGSTATTLADVLAAAQGKLNLNSGSGDIGTFEIGECTVVALSGSNYIVKDDTAVMLLYSKTASKVGDVIKMVGKVTNFYGIAEINNPTITKVSSDAPVNHGTPTEFTESVINSFLKAPYVGYMHAKGVVSSDGKSLAVGAETVTLYVALASEAGKTVDVYGYAIGKSSKGTVNFINTSYESEGGESGEGGDDGDKPVVENPSWQRVTAVNEITAGGTFIIGYEATAKSGVIVPMRNEGSATTSAAGFIYSGTTAGASSNGTINMGSVTSTSDFEVTIVPSTAVPGAVCIKIGSNFIGNTNTKNNCKLFASESKTTAFGVSIAANDVVTFKIAANESYNTFQYNSNKGSERFAVYTGGQKNLVLYKKK